MKKNKIYIGDNLKVMNSTALNNFKNKVGFIYIDPPYNTANKNFAYNDKNDSWSSDIKERLELASTFMKQEGVIFISIDDNELSNLLYVCYKVFGKENYVGLFVTKQAQRSNAKHINTIHEYVICFAKNKKKLDKFYINRIENPSESDAIKNIINKVKKAMATSISDANVELKKSIEKYVIDTGETWIKNYSNIDDNGNIYFAKDLSTPAKPNRLDIEEIGLHLEPLKTRGWSSKEKILDLHRKNRLVFKGNRPYAIEYLDEAVNNVSSILDFYSRQGTNDLKKLGLDGLFDTPKPVELIKFLIRCSQHDDTLIMDFYAGSGTTAQAVYEINNEDKMKHNYILIQIDEKINKNNDAYHVMEKMGYMNATIDKAMLVRINKYLSLNNKIVDYDIEVIE